MKAINKIRRYIICQKASGELESGDKLPPYRELTKLFQCSLQTVRTALIKLEKEGLIETVSGVGCFVNGREPLSLAIDGIPVTTVEPEKFQRLMDSYVDKHDLHIKVKVNPSTDNNNLSDFSAVLSANNKNIGKTLCDFSEFPDYYNLLEKLQSFPYSISSFAVPFFYLTHHAGVHKKTLQKIGMSADSLSSDFSWWPQYVKKCLNHKITPASICWPKDNLVAFGKLVNLFFALKFNSRKHSCPINDIFEMPVFNSEAGRLLLSIIDDCQMATDVSESYNKSGGINFKLGSWINVPNKYREKVIPENITIVPYKFENRKILLVSPKCLHLHLSQKISEDEKKRLWKLVKIMLSNDFQKDFCTLSGVISVRKDFSEQDYFWAENSEMANAFLPKPEDIIIYEDIFPLAYISLLTAAIELYKQKTISADEALVLMDKKFTRR